MYENTQKTQARGWAWNQICKRIPHRLNRRKARIYCLIGDTNLELSTAEKKDFSALNIVGVDIRKEPVERWREAGGLAIQAPLEAVIALSKVRPQGVIADFCGGLTKDTRDTFGMALMNTTVPGCVVINLLRGRDQIKKFRGEDLLQMASVVGGVKDLTKRSRILILDLFREVCENNPKHKSFLVEMESIMKDADNRKPGSTRAYRHADDYFTQNMLFPFLNKLQPKAYAYKSSDSNQWFDSLAVNSFHDEGIKRDLKVWLEAKKDTYDLPVIKRRLAALEAIRTQKINKLPAKRRLMYEAA